MRELLNGQVNAPKFQEKKGILDGKIVIVPAMYSDAESSKLEKSICTGSTIQIGHNVLLKLPNGEFKSVKVDKNS